MSKMMRTIMAKTAPIEVHLWSEGEHPISSTFPRQPSSIRSHLRAQRTTFSVTASGQLKSEAVMFLMVVPSRQDSFQFGLVERFACLFAKNGDVSSNLLSVESQSEGEAHSPAHHCLHLAKLSWNGTVAIFQPNLFVPSGHSLSGSSQKVEFLHNVGSWSTAPHFRAT